jgi:predicted  nucleic acid-binding Zn-ribbon protein|tara:strand:+ start:547 stop:948 length:402 start_codon:yes stop_codon:yes gene_type:complete
MKSRLEKVYSKLPNQKVNLKAHKVELSLLNDFQETANRFNAIGSEMEIVANEGSNVLDKIDDIEKELIPLTKLKDELQEEYNNLKSNVISDYPEIDAEYNKIKNVAKELGIEYPKNIDESYRIASEYLKRANR